MVGHLLVLLISGLLYEPPFKSIVYIRLVCTNFDTRCKACYYKFPEAAPVR